MKVVHIGKALPKSWQPPEKLPSEIGACIDLLIQAKRERKRREEFVKAAESEETRVEEHIIQVFEKQKIKGAKGKLGSISLSEKDVPRIVDFEAFCRYVQKKQAWDLFTKRAHETASQARWEAGEEIPGIEKFHKIGLSVSEK